jgi:hypothetical protein
VHPWSLWFSVDSVTRNSDGRPGHGIGRSRRARPCGVLVGSQAPSKSRRLSRAVCAVRVALSESRRPSRAVPSSQVTVEVSASESRRHRATRVMSFIFRPVQAAVGAVTVTATGWYQSR